MDYCKKIGENSVEYGGNFVECEHVVSMGESGVCFEFECMVMHAGNILFCMISQAYFLCYDPFCMICMY